MTTSSESGHLTAKVRALAWLRSQKWLRNSYRALPGPFREGVLRLLTRRLQARTRFERTSAWFAWQSRKSISPMVSATVANAELPGVNIIGYINGQFGLAEAARSYARALIANRVPVALRNVDLGLPNARDEHELDLYIDNDMPHMVCIIFVNPDYLDQALAEIGKARLQGHYLIACWFWELESIPAAWLPALDLVDEVLVATSFVEQALRRVTNKPVLKVPMPLGPSMDSGLTRADFGLPDDAFVFLATFDFSSRMERKNPEAAIRSFLEAFPRDRADVRLLVKSSNGYRFPHWLQHLLQLADGDDRILIRDEVIEREHLSALHRCCDAYVSLHRAEGFGMGLAECMALGKPVIATAWSGNMEFMDAESVALVDYTLVPLTEGEYPGGEGQRWADADIAQAAIWMRRLVDEPAVAAAFGRKAKHKIETTLSGQVAAAGILERLAQIQDGAAQSRNQHIDIEVRGTQ